MIEITPIRDIYEKDGRVQLMYNTQHYNWLLVDKDEVLLPVGKSKNSFDYGNHHVVLSELDKLQFRICTDYDGYSPRFVAFTKVKDKIYMVEMAPDSFKGKERRMVCTLEEKDKILNGFKKPNSIILREDGPHIFYYNFPTVGEMDKFNKKTEDELLAVAKTREMFFRSLFKADVGEFGANIPEHEIDPNNVDVDMYGGVFDVKDCAIEFLSNTNVRYTEFSAKMRGVNNYEITLCEKRIDFESIRRNNILLGAFKWDEKKCPYDPDKETLKKVEDLRIKTQKGVAPKNFGKQ